MKTIEKQPQIALGFHKWVKDNQIAIKKGSKLWDDLSQNAKNSLQNALISEQGHICCFCGSRIYRPNTEIAHFVPRNSEDGKPLIFDYTNLFASCNGRTNYVEYQDSIRRKAIGIANDFGTNVIYKEFSEIIDIDNTNVIYYNNQNTKKSYLIRNTDTYESLFSELGTLYVKGITPYNDNDIINAGTKVIIYPPLKDHSQHHCNNKQGENRLSFSFLDENLSSYFYFDFEGLMKSYSLELVNDINNLNLNTTYLCDKRKNYVREIEKFVEENYTDEEIRLFYSKYTIIENGKLPVFAFVYANELKRRFGWL